MADLKQSGLGREMLACHTTHLSSSIIYGAARGTAAIWLSVIGITCQGSVGGIPQIPLRFDRFDGNVEYASGSAGGN